jgi:hypothetical protein
MAGKFLQTQSCRLIVNPQLSTYFRLLDLKYSKQILMECVKKIIVTGLREHSEVVIVKCFLYYCTSLEVYFKRI